MIAAPDGGTALTLLAELSREGRVTTGAEVAELLVGWGFVRGPNLDPQVGEEVMFYIHPQYPHLQMSIPSAGRVHGYVVEYATGLVRTLRVHGEPKDVGGV